ncbi:NUDIX hydrolase [Streptococcaceae bacterium ESL0729]|nr:NUDIX hydrolase [Streptococcaceae bacterium ESL0729]
MKKTSHFGVYGVSFNSKGDLLCIEKTLGPYKGRFDLPGGSQEAGEGLTETLMREILEETGFTLLTYSNPRIYDAMVKVENGDFFVHHIMALYDFKINEAIPQQSLPRLVEDGLNDSQAIKWLPLDQITLDNSSPLVLKVKDEILGNPVLDKSIYDGWEVK